MDWIVPLPKSDTPSRIIENRNVFDFVLDDESMIALDSLDEGAAGACSWNPVGHK
jgi:diketogulonate reductase-like aldo/keto reductase